MMLHVISIHIPLDITVDMGGLDIENELFEPLQKLLGQCKGAKALSK
jgi:dynactin 1